MVAVLDKLRYKSSVYIIHALYLVNNLVDNIWQLGFGTSIPTSSWHCCIIIQVEWEVVGPYPGQESTDISPTGGTLVLQNGQRLG